MPAAAALTPRAGVLMPTTLAASAIELRGDEPGVMSDHEGARSGKRCREQHETDPTPEALRTHILRLLGPKTVLEKAFGLF